MNIIRIHESEHNPDGCCIIDDIFDAGNAFVDIVNFKVGDVGITEYWSQGSLLSRNSGCSFGQHNGSFNIVWQNTEEAHRGSGSSGGWCSRIIVQSARCSACGTYITETRSEMFWCTRC
ncbi:MAG: hypothetical protein FWE34_08990 [Defluviitaleaceae bacterium]|nr:hypothetical protein [Defluviitaleaceae bacterium]